MDDKSKSMDINYKLIWVALMLFFSCVDLLKTKFQMY